jgi:uncharacterized protein (DUF2062 family)
MIGTLLGAAAVNYTIIHNPLVFVMIMALFIHEMGHYLVARKKGASPDFPFFLPLFPLIIGITRIKDLDYEHAPAVLLAGASFASLFILVIIFFNLFYRLFSFIPLFVMLGLEIFLNYFGVDGRKYRKIKSQMA